MQQQIPQEQSKPKYIEKLLNIQGKAISSETNLSNKLINFNLPMNFEKINKNNSEQIYDKYSLIKSNDIVNPVKESRGMKRLKKMEKEKTLGQKWEGMKAKELTPELKNELRVLKLRNYINPSEFYKSTEFKKFPKYFQIGTVVGGSDDYRPTRLVKRERKNNLVEQFLQDDKKENFSKKKFMEIQQSKQKIVRNKKIRKMKKFGKKIIKRQ